MLAEPALQGGWIFGVVLLDGLRFGSGVHLLTSDV
jgi:hypothetical protein